MLSLFPSEIATPFAFLNTAEQYSEVERSIAQGFMACVSRWGVGKTTIEDVARQAGVSRATIYRYFPGGRSTIMAAAWAMDVAEFIEAATERISRASTLEDALVGGMHTVAMHFGEHPALRFIREHEAAEFEQLVSFERMDTILLASGSAMGPLLSRFMAKNKAFEISVWVARILVSYLSEPADYVDMTSEESVRRFVRTFILPGIDSAESTANQTDPELSNNKTSINGDLTHTGDSNVHS